MIRPLTQTHDDPRPTPQPLVRLPTRYVRARRRDDAPTRLRAVVLLAGTPRLTALHRAVGRGVLDLPVAQTGGPCRVLDLWHEQVGQLADHLQRATLPLRVMVGQRLPAPRRPTGSASGTTAHGDGDGDLANRVPLSVERDPMALRGTGGLLRDVAADYDDDDHLLVVDAGRVLFEPLWLLFDRLLQTPGDVRLLAGRDDAPLGLTLLRCGCVRDLPPVGFVDFKEQALPRLAARYDVRVARWWRDPGQRLGTLAEYLAAVRCWHDCSWRLRPGDALAYGGGGDGASWRAGFAVIERGAVVDGSAMLLDAVVLAGGRVEAGATVARCVVGPGGCVGMGQVQRDALIASHGAGVVRDALV